MKRVGLFVLVVFIVLSDNAWAQCAMCKATAEAGQANDIEFGRNINIGILILMILPYIILFLLFRKHIVKLFRALAKK
jgi:ABC-type glycerol-3-phosphate transport system permease component